MNSKFDSETKIWKGVEIPWNFPENVYINEFVLESLEKTPEKIIQICDDDGVSMTCEEFRVKIIRFAQNLTSFGIKSEDVVGIVCTNSKNLSAFVHGIVQLGAVPNPMAVEHSENDLFNIFGQTKPKLVICDAVVADKVLSALKRLGSSAAVFTTVEKVEGLTFADDFLEPTGKENEYEPPKFKDPNMKIMAILPSSGSSGPIKGVCMSQCWFLKLKSSAALTEARSLSFSPIFWGSAFAGIIMSSMMNEVRIVTKKSFSPEIFFDIATRHKVTHFLMNPPALTLLLQSPLIKKFDKSYVQLILSLGGVVTEQLRIWFKREFPGVFFWIFYSLTEVSCSATFPGVPINGLSVGFVCSNHAMKVVDDEGKALEIGEVGELCSKFIISPFLGYYGNPQASKDAVDEEGFVKTGDLGFIDKDGFVFVIDRKKEIFKCRGHHINPTDIENIIQKLEGVEFVAVVGLTNPETYNDIAAVIQKKKGFALLSEEDVHNFIQKELPSYQQLEGGVYFVEKIPMTASGKILKREAKEIATKIFNNKRK